MAGRHRLDFVDDIDPFCRADGVGPRRPGAKRWTVPINTLARGGLTALASTRNTLTGSAVDHRATHVSGIYGLPLRCKCVFAGGFRIGLQTIYPAFRCVRRRGP